MPCLKTLKRSRQGFQAGTRQPADWRNRNVNSLQLAIAQAGATIAEKEVERNRGGHYPTVDVVANYSKNGASGGGFGVGSDSTNEERRFAAEHAAVSGGQCQFQMARAEANRERASQELENARRNVAQQTRQAYLGCGQRHCPSQGAATGARIWRKRSRSQ